MWQQLVAGVIVLAAAVYAARTLGPKRWRRRQRDAAGARTEHGDAGAIRTAPGPCGCGKDEGGCH
jgi:hypothetical protein